MKAGRRQRRAHILEVAERLLSHYGPSKTTIADIAREAGIGVGSVYLEFESKDAIVNALSRERHDVVLTAMRAAARGDGTFAERFEAILLARVDALFGLASGGQHACDLVLCPSSAVQGAHETYRLEERRFFAELLRQAGERGECAARDAEATAELLQRALAAFSPPHVFTESRVRVREWVAMLGGLLLQGLLPRAGPTARAVATPARPRRSPPAR